MDKALTRYKPKGLYLFWTMVDGREKNGLYDLYEDVIAEMGLSVLSTRLPDSKKFRRDLSEERKSVPSSAGHRDALAPP